MDLLTKSKEMVLTQVTGQFTDKPTCSQSNLGLVNSWTRQFAD